MDRPITKDSITATQYTLWLLPAEPLANDLRGVIHDLAWEFDAPEFDPHVTIYVGPSSTNEACKTAGAMAAQLRALDLEMQKLDHSAVYSKTFFAQFHESVPLRRMSDLARASVAIPSEYSLNPHLSLLYKHLPEETRLALCRRSIIPEGAYHLDRIRAVEFESPWSETTAKQTRTLTELQLQNA
jgi:hypothetical protein